MHPIEEYLNDKPRLATQCPHGGNSEHEGCARERRMFYEQFGVLGSVVCVCCVSVGTGRWTS